MIGNAGGQAQVSEGKRTSDLARVARNALPFIAYAFDKGVDGAEEAGRAIESCVNAVEAALAATGQQQVGGAERERFEAWAQSNNYSSLKWPDGAYAEDAMQLAWKAWQHLAARQPGAQVPVADWSKRGGIPTDWRNELLTLAEHHGPIPAFARSAMRVIARSMPAPPAQGIDLGQKALAVVDRKVKWREAEVESLQAATVKVSTHMDHIRIHEACLSDLHEVRKALIDQRDAAPGVGS